MPGRDDVARIVVELDTGPAQRSLRGLNRDGQRAADGVGKARGGAGGGGSGISGGASTATGGAGGRRGGAGGTPPMSAGPGGRPPGAPGGGGMGISPALMMSMAAVASAPLLAAGGAFASGTLGRAAGSAADLGRAAAVGVGATIERTVFSGAAEARGRMTALEETKNIFGLVTGLSGDTGAAEAYYKGIKGLRMAQQTGERMIDESPIGADVASNAAADLASSPIFGMFGFLMKQIRDDVQKMLEKL